ncbi:hypothetical protein AVEN_169063-1, partial [Araneus ventricosus]
MEFDELLNESIHFFINAPFTSWMDLREGREGALILLRESNIFRKFSLETRNGNSFGESHTFKMIINQ